MEIDISGFRKYLLDEKRSSHSTIACYCSDINCFNGFVRSYHDTTKSNMPIRKYMILFIARLHETHASRGIARKIATLRAYCAFIGEQPPKLDNQVFRVRTYTHESGDIEEHDDIKPACAARDEDIVALMRVAMRDTSLIGMRNQVMISLLTSTDMRIGDLLTIRMEHIRHSHDIDGDKSVSIAIVRKNIEEIVVIAVPVPVSELLSTYMARLVRHDPTAQYLFPSFSLSGTATLSRQALWVLIRQLWSQAGITRFLSPNTMRRMYRVKALHDFLADHQDLLCTYACDEQRQSWGAGKHMTDEHVRIVYATKHPRS